jgi:predicted  nucleic acid-binding Zn-ribbon protein
MGIMSEEGSKLYNSLDKDIYENKEYKKLRFKREQLLKDLEKINTFWEAISGKKSTHEENIQADKYNNLQNELEEELEIINNQLRQMNKEIKKIKTANKNKKVFFRRNL